jgi:DNA-directed RNA polymerase II subunit RPB1
MNNIRIVTFKDIVDNVKIYFDPNDSLKDDQDFIDFRKKMFDEPQTTNTSPWVLRFEFNKEHILKYNLDMNTIHAKLLDYYHDHNIKCTFNDDNAEKLVFRIKFNKKDDNDDMLIDIKALEYSSMEKLIIKGTLRIEKVTLEKQDIQRYNPMKKEFDKYEEYVVYTEGTNFAEIMANPAVDAAIAYTNDINEVNDVLGIEAARQALFNEIQLVLESVTVNYRHVALLVDVQTNKGYIMSIDRHGINRGDIGPLAKCSFEESTVKLIKAGIFAEYDKINGVSANIMLGQIVPAGTGDVCVIMDEAKLGNNNEGYDDELVMEEACGEDSFTFDFTIPTISTEILPLRTPNKIQKK